MLKRKIDSFLLDWKKRKNHKPLIISGARQIGKTTSIRELGKSYESFIEINFITMREFMEVFEGDLRIDSIIKKISLINPSFKFIPGSTLILLDEIQGCPNAVTALKPFSEDNRFDVICSGSLLGVNYNQISSIPVGFKEEYQMYSLDFEEFLWANGYDDDLIETIYSYMIRLEKLPNIYMNKLNELFNDYVFVGGMPEAVNSFIDTKLYTNVFDIQNRIYKDYEDDITKYVLGLDKSKVKNVYRHITPQLAKDNHKFQITKLSHGARARDYFGIEEWLKDAGIINVAYNLEKLDFPFSAYEKSDYFRIYYADHSLFIASLDEESKKDLIANKNYEIYNGALYESLVSEALVKSGYKLYFFKTTDATIELDFVIRRKNSIIPLEVKRNRGRSKSLNTIISGDNNIKLGIKLSRNNIGISDGKITLPYFLTFLLKRYLEETKLISW